MTKSPHACGWDSPSCKARVDDATAVLAARLAEASALISSQGIRLMEADDIAARLAEAVVLLHETLEYVSSEAWDDEVGDRIDAFLRPTVSASGVQSNQPEGRTDSCWFRCCLDYPRCDCNSPPEPDGAPALQPCGHPWKAQHDSKCILCSSPGVTP